MIGLGSPESIFKFISYEVLMEKVAVFLLAALTAGSVQAFCFGKSEEGTVPLTDATLVEKVLKQDREKIIVTVSDSYLYDLAMCKEFGDRLTNKLYNAQVLRKIALLKPEDEKVVNKHYRKISSSTYREDAIFAIRDYCISVNIYGW